MNLLAQCRSGALGYHRAQCKGCGHTSILAASCGDRHCPQCLGPRQAKWAQATCERLPDCPHFHLVFSPPKELWAVFEGNYRQIAGVLFAAAAECLQSFQRNNWQCSTGLFLAVLHTWGSQLNWHPHLHVLVAAGGVGAKSGAWKQARADYAFPVRAMPKVFRAIFVRKLEEQETEGSMRWPEDLGTVEARRSWRVRLCGCSWNIHAKATLHNTRAAVRYLARYTSRIAISNTRITRVDAQARTVSFGWTDYRDGGKRKEMTLPGAEFIRRFARHLVPPGFRRVRQYGLLCGRSARFKEHQGAPQNSISEEPVARNLSACPCCRGSDWAFLVVRPPRHVLQDTARKGAAGSFSHGGQRAGPD